METVPDTFFIAATNFAVLVHDSAADRHGLVPNRALNLDTRGPRDCRLAAVWRDYHCRAPLEGDRDTVPGIGDNLSVYLDLRAVDTVFVNAAGDLELVSVAERLEADFWKTRIDKTTHPYPSGYSFTSTTRRTRMRRKKEAVLSFESNDQGLPKVIRDYRARYRSISQVLDKNPQILDLVDRDLQKLSQGGREGRKGDFTSENILRALIVQDMEGLPFREAVIRMGGDGFLQDFLRTRKKAVMDFTFLNKCSLAIQPETWKRVNEVLGRYGVGQGYNPKVIRTDTTVMESNIHYPTDASLLWDTWRVARGC